MTPERGILDDLSKHETSGVSEGRTIGKNALVKGPLESLGRKKLSRN